jgi:hypothetical protein
MLAAKAPVGVALKASKSLTFGPVFTYSAFRMNTRYYSWFAFTYRFSWWGSGQRRIARVSE